MWHKNDKNINKASGARKCLFDVAKIYPLENKYLAEISLHSNLAISGFLERVLNFILMTENGLKMTFGFNFSQKRSYSNFQEIT